MTTVTAFPRKVREIETMWIALAAGTRLAARVWMPRDAEQKPVPAILEYVPYRRRDSTATRDALLHPYVAGHGYACVRVDIRGSGDSDGLITDEYLPQELQDGVEIVAWLARQPWCSGTVGMIGNSWGGFNGLQIAALRPPALKAIITSCSTDDRYADDVHYMGGCLLNNNQRWGSTMFAYNGRPPDPTVVGERWRAMMFDRLENSGLWIRNWMEHQRRDAFWKHGSVCENYADIQCAVYAVGGWVDGYSNAIPRLMAGLRCPRKAMIGQWGHRYPHQATPGPAVGFLQEAVRWWDHWLKGVDNGIMDEPSLRIWMQDSVPPRSFYETLPGRWVAEAQWPPTSTTSRRFALNPGRIEVQAAPEAALTVCSAQTVGKSVVRWCGFGLIPDMPGDQREEDGGSLCFDTAPLDETLEILGAPVVELDLSSDKPQAYVAVRLCDVAPSGASNRITYGLLNLSHRDSHEHPKPLLPGQQYRVRVQLNDLGQVIPKGHRLRIAVSTCYWPIAWPSPEAATLTVHSGTSTLSLPIRGASALDSKLKPLPPVETPPPLRTTTLKPGGFSQHMDVDKTTGDTTIRLESDSGTTRLDGIGLEMATKTTEMYAINPEDPLSARTEIGWSLGLRRGDWRFRSESLTTMTATKTHFRLQARLDAYEGDVRVFSRDWDEQIKRDHQ
jgi:putative CocE/NonD family hydrolase